MTLPAGGTINRTAPRDLLIGLVKSCHPVPSVAVTGLAAIYAVSAGLALSRIVLVAVAVLAGQLSIGWSNDLIDRRRDRAAGRRDKPLAVGELSASSARAACVVALFAAVGLSMACGLLAGAVHLAGVAAAWSYNLGIKATAWSWLPYAVAFGGLPVFISLAGAQVAAWWVPVSGALLGVGAHLMNATPDRDADAAAGMHGLVVRLGPQRATWLAVSCLVGASILLAIDARVAPVTAVAALVAVAVLVAVVLLGGRKMPFYATIGIALADVLLLVMAA